MIWESLPTTFPGIPFERYYPARKGGNAYLNSSSVSSVSFAVLLSARLVAAPLNSAAPLLLAELASSAMNTRRFQHSLSGELISLH